MTDMTELAERFQAVLAKRKAEYDALTKEQKDALAEQESAESNRQESEKLMQELRYSNCPMRQLRVKTLDRTGEWGARESYIKSKLGTGFTFALIGTRGCGKTQLGVEIIRHQAKQGKVSKYFTATQFGLRIKSTYRQGSQETEQDVISEYCKSSLVVIDEIGMRSESEWENRLLYELLNQRYNGMKDTILISNQTLEEFQLSIGPSLVSRMQETGGIIQCNWESYRGASDVPAEIDKAFDEYKSNLTPPRPSF